MSDFGDRPFVAGALTGIRSFRPVGERLVAPVQGMPVWQPGENVAECLLMAEHRAGSLGCRCGFYAYFELGYNPHHRPSNVLGLIEGYGVATVGARGFRCEKARIVALIAPDVPDFDLGFVFANYPGVALFNSVEEAVAKFPLTVPEGTPDIPPPTGPAGAWVTVIPNAANFMRQMKTVIEAANIAVAQVGTEFAKLAEALRAGQLVIHDETHQFRDETPMARALRLRRTRNTGPQDRRRLDGVRR